jgi:hypothetical protein
MAGSKGSKPDLDLDEGETLIVGLGGKTYTISNSMATPGLDRRIFRWFEAYGATSSEEEDAAVDAEFRALMARVLGISEEEAQRVSHKGGVEVLRFLVRPLTQIGTTTSSGPPSESSEPTEAE